MINVVLIVMGVSGVGKSTIAEAVNTHLHWPFQEGDDLHPAANVKKMHAGIALTDADRAPWLAAVKRWIDARLAAGEPGLITCSALKRRYRDMLVDKRSHVRLLYLKASDAVIEAQLEHRTGHFMPASLMESQLHTLEEPDADEHPITVSVHGTVEETAERVLAALGAEY
jgi:carbohydrate kinase (thermoresistant glucokinase family)